MGSSGINASTFFFFFFFFSTTGKSYPHKDLCCCHSQAKPVEPLPTQPPHRARRVGQLHLKIYWRRNQETSSLHVGLPSHLAQAFEVVIRLLVRVRCHRLNLRAILRMPLLVLLLVLWSVCPH